MKYDTAIPIGPGASGEVLKAWDPTLRRFVNPGYGGYRIHVAYAYLELAHHLRTRGADFAEEVEQGLSWAERILEDRPLDEEAQAVRSELRGF